MATEIVIIGAGYAGIAAARQLGKTFKKDDSVNITLVDKHSFHTYMTELHEVAGGRVEADAIKYDLRRIFKKTPKVSLVTDTVESIDYEQKKVIATHNTFQFDYLLLAMGGQANDFGVAGVKEYGFALWSIEEAERIRAHILDSVYKASREHDESKRRALLSFLVCGAGFTGVEMVGELVEWIPRLAKDYKLNLDEFSVHLVEAGNNILQMVTPKEQDKAMRYMQKVGIQVTLQDGIVEVSPRQVTLQSGKTISTHTTIWTSGVQANQDTANFGIEKGHAGRLIANEYMEAKDHENVYIAGDLVYFEEEQYGNAPVPQIVQAAEQTGHTAATNITAAIKGGPKHAYKGKYDGFMVSIGSRYGVAHLMGKYHLSGFWAMLVKHLVNLLYFFTIRSFYYMVAYVQHEFFHIKDGRNIFRKHLATYGNVLWSVPLRLFYGSMWLYEGIKKAFGLFGTTSWLSDEHLVFPFEWLQEATVSGATEATTAASEVIAETTHTVFSLNYAYGESPMPVLESMPDWFASIMKFMMPNRDVAFFMQKMMTFVEIAIGLALIAGVFVWLVSAGTIALVTMFCLSGMFYWVNIWFVPVAIALMNGSGRAFGLDYWIQPWIWKHLDRWLYGRPQHIYQDK